MGKIVEFFLDRPLLVNLIIIAVVGLGIRGAMNAKKEGFPEISMNKIIIQTIFPGASSGDVEINVTVPIEEALEEVEGIKEILSVSQEGISRIEIQADDDATPKEFSKLYNKIDSALSEIDDLPEGINGKPVMDEFTSSDIPVMEISFTGQYKILKPYIDHLELKIKKLNGVSSVDVIGLPDEEVHILVNPFLARKNMVGLRMISNAIKKRNLEGSGGTLESFIGEKKVVFINKFHNYKDVMDTNIIMNTDGYGVKLKEVAKIKIVPEDMKLIVRNNGKRGATLSIKKKGSSDLIDTVNKINLLLGKEKLPAGVEMKKLFDQSKFTRNRLNLLVNNAMIGFILVFIILFLIFNVKVAIWTAFGIPFTFFGMLMFMESIGLSINLISLGGFILIIGMVVDDAIVISEEINSNKELGMESKEAAIEAVKKMWMPVLTACLTTMVAFSPMFSIGGFPGKFVWAIPLMVIVGLSISLFESFFILPVHLYHGKPGKIKKKQFVVKLELLYEKFLIKAVKYRYAVLGLLLVVLFVSGFAMKNFVKKDPFPQEGAEGFSIAVDLPRGTPLAKTEKNIQKIEKVLLELPPGEIVGFSTRIGTHSELSATTRGSQNNIAIILVYLKPFEERSRNVREIMNAVEYSVRKVLVNRKINISLNLKRLGPPMGRPFEIRVVSNNEKKRFEKSQEIIKFLETIKGVSDIETDEIEGKNELNIVIDHDILSMTGLTVADVITTLRIAFDGLIVTDMLRQGKRIDFRLRLNKQARGDINFCSSLPIVNSRGNLINMKEFVKLKEQPSRAEIRHVDGRKSTTVFGNLDIKVISPMAVINKVKKNFHSDENAAIEFAGQPVESEKIFKGLASAAVVAFIGIFLLISLMFNSFVKPLIIMLTLPFLIVGLTVVLLTHGIPASMMSGLAMVGLMGVVVNDSIVMVHKINEMSKDGGITPSLIIKGAVSRLRPVLLTTITTIFGVLPTGYGLGGYDPFLSQMSVVLAYGLFFGTFIILILVPILYNIGLDFKKLLKRDDALQVNEINI